MRVSRNLLRLINRGIKRSVNMSQAVLWFNHFQELFLKLCALVMVLNLAVNSSLLFTKG